MKLTCKLKVIFITSFRASPMPSPQVLDSGHRIPRHPLLCLAPRRRRRPGSAVDDFRPGDPAGPAALEEGCGAEPEDVAAEARRVELQEEAGEGGDAGDAVVLVGLRKVFEGAGADRGDKVAVRGLSMGVRHGECFGMLGPNGAGKTTAISMLVRLRTHTHTHANAEAVSGLGRAGPGRIGSFRFGLVGAAWRGYRVWCGCAGGPAARVGSLWV
jgi:hypothetical protein